jgi:hypothetical protein
LFFLGIQPPSSYALPITIGFIISAFHRLVRVGAASTPGPPMGDGIAAREAAIRAAEKAVGELS